MTEQPMSASRMAKACGLPNLEYVTTKTGISRQTLIDWRNNRPQLWSVILAGCAAIHEDEKATGTTLEAKREKDRVEASDESEQIEHRDAGGANE